MSPSLISIAQAAQRLKVRPDYIAQLVAKGRLQFVGEQQLAADEVEKLAQLMDKLRHNGIATLVNISAQGGNPLES